MSDLNSGVFQFIQFVPWKLIPNITGTNGSTWTNGEFFGVSDVCLFFISILYTYLMEGIRAILLKLTLTTYSRDAKTTGFSNFIRLGNAHYK